MSIRGLFALSLAVGSREGMGVPLMPFREAPGTIYIRGDVREKEIYKHRL